MLFFLFVISDDYLIYYLNDEICEVVEEKRRNIFEELVRRNGIKIGKLVVLIEVLNIVGVVVDNFCG